MATRAEMNSAKKRVELLLASQNESYEDWLYHVHCQFVDDSDDVILKALTLYAEQKSSLKTIDG